MDVLSNNDENATMEMWYRLLNCGFRVAISAGTDSFTNVADHYIAGAAAFTCNRAPASITRPGSRIPASGRSFASNGPVMTLEVDGKVPWRRSQIRRRPRRSR